MAQEYFKLGVLAVFPAALSVVFELLQKRSGFGKLSYGLQQLILGLAFGGLAVFGTEFGIPVQGAMINARDAAPLCAGLFFGAPAALISGVIGGVERWVSVAWGIGSYTRVACSVSTLLAGVYAALIRKKLLDDNRSGMPMALVSIFEMEVFHLSMVFLTNVRDATHAAKVVQACAAPMLIVNCLGVVFAAAALALVNKTPLRRRGEEPGISGSIQNNLLITVVIAFFATTVLFYMLQTNISQNESDRILQQSISDVRASLQESLEMEGGAGAAAVHRHVGEDGLTVVLSEEGKLLSITDGFDVRAFPMSLLEDREPEISFEAAWDGVEWRIRYERCDSYIIAAFHPVSEAYLSRDIMLYVNSFMEVLVFGTTFVVIFLKIKRVVVDKVYDINRDLGNIVAGNLDTVVTAGGSREITALSGDINRTVDTLKKYIEEASARIAQELQMAKDIQASALPGIFPAFPNRKELDIYASMNPAKEVGGDFYDFYLGENSRLYFVVADVSGKGIPAALFMMRAKTALKALADSAADLGEVFTHCNAELCAGNDTGMFVTAWMGVLNLENGELEYVNAGHNPPLIGGEQGFERVPARAGFVLAGFDGMKYKSARRNLKPGEVLFLYTDGVTEAANSDNELYGEDRLKAALDRVGGGEARRYCELVKADMETFVGDAPQADDITMMALVYKGPALRRVWRREKADVSDIPAVTQMMETLLEEASCPMPVTAKLCVAMDEIYCNIAQYAYEEAGPAEVEMTILENASGIRLVFTDEGKPFNPLEKINPDMARNVLDDRVGGWGITMVKNLVDEMSYEYRDGRNRLKLVKRF